MRVISGKFRGRNLLSPFGKDVRPTSDLVKESIFDTIQTGVSGCKFLDLFAGSGGVGIEALSRNAKKVMFADSSKSSLDLVKKNLEGLSGDVKTLLAAYPDALRRSGEEWDYIFIDPPYETNYFENIANIVYERKLLAQDGLLIYEHLKGKEYNIPEEFILKKSKKYGSIIVDYIGLAENKAKDQAIADSEGNYFIEASKLTDEQKGGRCVFAGSFDPITLGHISLIDRASKDFDEVVVVVAINEEKEYLIDLQGRVAIARAALKDRLDAYAIACEGMLYEKCNELNINTIIRGYRDEKDFAYENYMAKFNKEHGGITTVLYRAEGQYAQVSSSQVRNALDNAEDLSNLLPKNIIESVKKYYTEKKDER